MAVAAATEITTAVAVAVIAAVLAVTHAVARAMQTHAVVADMPAAVAITAVADMAVTAV